MKLFIFIFYYIILNNAFGQVGEWTWIHGSNTANSIGNYGIQGVPSPANEPPSLYEPCEWTDLNGKFWMYGGAKSGSGSMPNDLWKYDPVTNEWTWMWGTNSINDPGVYGIQGVPSPANKPPSKGWAAASWVDLNGNFWMFGGCCGNLTRYNDLWKYDIASNEWTWMKGSNTSGQTGVYGLRGIADTANNPGGRWECASAWTDNAGDLWLFGGYNGNTYGDLWRFNIATNSWTWMKGSNTTNQNGVYGLQGVEDSLNDPGSRAAYCRWKDLNGNLWLFGGLVTSVFDNLNDLWKYNIATNNWTWMSGSNLAGQSGNYGQKCNMSVQNIPTNRFENRAAWTDQNGNFWMFGGSSYNQSGLFNDLWKYCVSTNQWAWINGDSIPNPAGNWGTLGVSAPTNKPDGRSGVISWTDHNNHLYLFGGTCTASSTINDLWKYTLDTTCAPCATSIILPTANFISSDSAFCSGDCINFTNISQHSNSYQWLFQGGTPSSDTSANPHGICYFNSGTFDVTLIATNANGSDTLTLPDFITIYPQIPFSALTQNSDTLFSIQGYPSYEWFDGATIITNATNYYYVATHSGNYSVVVTDSNGCFATAQMLNVIASAKDIQLSINDFIAQYYYGDLHMNIVSTITSSSVIQIKDALGKDIYFRNILLKDGKNEFVLPLENISTGMYFITILNSKMNLTRKIFIQKK